LYVSTLTFTYNSKKQKGKAYKSDLNHNLWLVLAYIDMIKTEQFEGLDIRARGSVLLC